MSKFSPKLFHCWHPVAYGHEVANSYRRAMQELGLDYYHHLDAV